MKIQLNVIKRYKKIEVRTLTSLDGCLHIGDGGITAHLERVSLVCRQAKGSSVHRHTITDMATAMGNTSSVRITFSHRPEITVTIASLADDQMNLIWCKRLSSLLELGEQQVFSPVRTKSCMMKSSLSNGSPVLSSGQVVKSEM